MLPLPHLQFENEARHNFVYLQKRTTKIFAHIKKLQALLQKIIKKKL